MQEFVQYIVKNLVDEPEKVDVKCIEGDKGIIVEVRVGENDVGKVVGKKGATINAIRTIAMMVCARLGRKVRIEVIE